MTIRNPMFATGTGGRLPVIVYVLLAGLCLLLWLPGFFDLPPFDRDEARFAQASSQMLASGDLVDIRFQEEVRHKKPVGIYWLQTASTALLGGDGAREIWTYRVPSLVGGIVAVVLTAWAGAWLFGPAVGVMAGGMLAASVVLGVEARMAKTDAALLAVIVAAQAALALLYVRRREEKAELGPALAFWVAMGLAVLLKGPIAALVSGGTLAMLAVWDRSARWMKRLRPVTGLLIVAAIAAPWLIAIGIKTDGAFFTASLGNDMMAKVGSGQEGKGLPPGYYLGTFWITFAPFAFLVPLAVPWIWANRHKDVVRFCVAWILPAWVVFELVPTKLLHYTLPVFPAIALLTARAALDHFGMSPERPRRILFAVAAGLGVVTVAVLAGAVIAVPWAVDGRVDIRAVLAFPFAVGGVAAVAWMVRKGQEGRAVAVGLIGFAAFYAITYQAVLPAVEGVWISRQAERLVDTVRPCPTTVVASAGYTEPSLVFLLGTDTRLTGGGGGAAEHMLADPACALALVSSEEAGAFRAALGGREPRELGRVTGFNYNRGKRVELTLYGLFPAATGR